MSTATTRFLIAYARIAYDKKATPKVSLKGDTIYFGGVAQTEEEAHQCARELVTKHHTTGIPILPRVFPLEEGGLLDAMLDAQDKFEQIIRDMNDAAAVTDRPFRVKR